MVPKFFSENVSLLLAAAEQQPLPRSEFVRRATWIGKVYLHQDGQDEAVTNAALDDLLAQGLLRKLDQKVGLTPKGQDALIGLEMSAGKLLQAINEVAIKEVRK